MIATSADRAELAYRLACRGYPFILAARVALTPPLTATRVADDGSRPGRELAEGVERQFGTVVRLMAAQTAGVP